MKTDRELLELAAKAAGVKGFWSTTIGGWDCLVSDGWHPWQPLHDDGDALRLAVRLDLLPKQDFWRERSVQYAMEAFSGDKQCPYASTRRAIVLAAASIGELLP